MESALHYLALYVGILGLLGCLLIKPLKYDYLENHGSEYIAQLELNKSLLSNNYCVSLVHGLRSKSFLYLFSISYLS
jgi:hypothetical protein